MGHSPYDGRVKQRSTLILATPQSSVAFYALAGAIVLGAVMLRLALLPIHDQHTYLTLYPAVVAAFVLCGAGPGRVAVVLGALAGFMINTYPHFGAGLRSTGAVLSTGFFILSTLFMGELVERLHRTGKRLADTAARLATSEQHLKAVVHDQSDLICRYRPDGTVLFANDAYGQIFGLTRDAALTHAWMECVWPEDRARVQGELARLSPEQPVVTVEHRLRDAQERLRWVQFVNRGFFDEQGRLTEVQAVGRDFTDRRTLEVQLAASAAEVHDLFDNAPCGYLALDSDGLFVRINALALSWLDCERGDVIGRLSLQDFFTAEGRARFHQGYARFVADGHLGPLEFDLLSRRGVKRRVSLMATAVRDEDGRFLMFRTVVVDISELHRVRTALDEVNREQAAMLDNDMVAIVKVVDRRITWQNRALDRLFGHAPQALIGQSTRCLYPDDASYLALAEAAYPAINQGLTYRSQLKMMHKDGEPLWVDLSGVLLSRERGETLWMMNDITALKRYQDNIEHLAFHDALTGLPNRHLLFDRINQAMQHCERSGQMLAVCYVDLDRFKPINDEHGHEVGDALLRVVVTRLLSCVRASDTVARIGGDEFVILLTPLDTLDECRPVIDRVNAVLASPIDLAGDVSLQVTASIGVACYPTHGQQAEALIALADEAMYDAKQAGRNQSSILGTL